MRLASHTDYCVFVSAVCVVYCKLLVTINYSIAPNRCLIAYRRTRALPRAVLWIVYATIILPRQIHGVT